MENKNDIKNAVPEQQQPTVIDKILENLSGQLGRKGLEFAINDEQQKEKIVGLEATIKKLNAQIEEMRKKISEEK